MNRLVACLALIPALALAGKKDAPPVPIVLASLPAAMRCDREELGNALTKELGKSKRFTLVPEATEGAFRLEITSCVRVEPRAGILSTGRGAADMHSTSRMGSESPLSAGREPLPTTVLEVSLAGKRAMRFARRSADRSFPDAARGLKKMIEETLETHGAWLAGGPAPLPSK